LRLEQCRIVQLEVSPQRIDARELVIVLRGAALEQERRVASRFVHAHGRRLIGAKEPERHQETRASALHGKDP
jgi:hypothetical protein